MKLNTVYCLVNFFHWISQEIKSYVIFRVASQERTNETRLCANVTENLFKVRGRQPQDSRVEVVAYPADCRGSLLSVTRHHSFK